MEEKYQEFIKYKFEDNPQYRPYMDSLLPTPPLSKIPYYKKKFYRQYVDKEFDISYDPEKKQEQPAPPPPQSPEEKKAEEKKEATTEPSASTSQSPPRSERKTLPWATKFQLMLFIVFLCTFPVGLLARSYYHGVPLCVAFVIGILKKYGIPKFNRWYWQGLLMDDHFHNLVSALVCILSFSSTVVVWIPILIRTIVFVAECVTLMGRGGNKLAQLVNKMTGTITTKRETLLTFKADFEIYAGFYVLAAVLMGWVSLMLPLFYWQILQVKYMLNGYTRIALDKLAAQMDEIIASSWCPFPLKWLLQGMRKLGSYMAKMTQPEQSQQQQPASS